MLQRIRGLLTPSLLANDYPALHGLRVIAIISVIQVHVSIVLQRAQLLHDNELYVTSLWTFFGMDLFFVMSGFLIGSLLLRQSSSESANTRTGIGRFYARRSFRVFPLYYVVLTALATLGTEAQRKTLWVEYLYLTNYYPFKVLPIVYWSWSLCVEEHFYVAAPLLVGALARVRGRHGRLALLIALWASGTLVRFVIAFSHRHVWNGGQVWEAMYTKTHTRFDTLIAGVLLAYAQHYYSDRLARLFGHAWVRALAFGFFAACVYLLMHPLLVREVWLVGTLYWGTITSAMYLVLIPALINAKGWISRVLSARPFLWIATFGYGVYLVHIPICEYWIVPTARHLRVAYALTDRPLWTISLALLMLSSLATAYVLHIVVEKPMLLARDRLAPSRSTAARQPEPRYSSDLSLR